MRRVFWRRLTAAPVAVALALVIGGEASASPYVHVHRGGSLATVGGEQRPVYPESSMPAFREAARRGFVLELDVKLTADRVPVVIHDGTLDRTTSCDGRVDSLTFDQLRAQCDLDTLGTAGNERALDPGDDRRAEVPSLREVLKLARERGVEINVEIKNLPTDPDFDPGSEYARRVADEIKASAFPPGRLIVQSFLPSNLDVIEADPYFERAETSFLTLRSLEAAGPPLADGAGYEWVSPQWPVSPGYVSNAHALGLRVVPYTIDTAADLRAATEAGVDAVITNDGRLARRVIRKAYPKPPDPPKRPTQRECRAAAASNLATPVESFHPDDSGPRVFAIQFKQDLENVVSYDAFRTKIECLVREYVRPRMADDRPNVIALTEDVGLMTLATGSRGKATRDLFADPGNIPGCSGAPAPCGVLVALGTLDAAYAPQLTAYNARYPGEMPGLGQTFVAGTDTFARGWMQTFSDVAKRYGVYILGSNNQPEFRESVDPNEVSTFADPDVPGARTAFVATGPEVYNEVFMWGPKDVTKEGPAPLRNVVTSNQKVPLTDIENALELTPGARGGPDAIENLAPYRLPGTKARISFATSLPAFVYDGGPVTPFGQQPDPSIDPCSDTARYYMRCMEKLGANLVMQDEANPGPWANPGGENGGEWQPLEWMSSTWRSSTDPTVSFDYNVTPFMVGNLADLTFDGQSAITQRGLRGTKGPRGRCNYVGDSRFLPGPPENDPAEYEVYAGPKRQFLTLAPWVVGDAPRDELRAVAAELEAGSGSEQENDYLETALIADLPFPVDRTRPSCNTGSVTVAGSCANLHAGSSLGERLLGTRRGDRLIALGGADRIRDGRGRDCVRAGQGSDRIRGGPGRDRFVGQRGDDTIDAQNGGRDRVSCGAGDDVARVDEADRVTSNCERVAVAIAN